MRTPVVHQHTFPNGFELVYQRSTGAPVLALDLWVRVGSASETQAQAGLSHVVEHMLFKGTRRRGPGQVAREVEALGGEINAFTSFDHTVYTLLLASRYAEQGLDILHDAATSSTFDREEMAREKLVILEEVKRSRDNPQLYLSRKLFDTAYSRHPYGKPVIGVEETIQSFQPRHGKQYVRRWYRPANMVLCAVGALPFSEMVEKTAATFGAMTPTPHPRRVGRPREPRPQGFRAFMEPRDVTEVYFNLAFPGCAADHEDAVALEMLTSILGQGESSRLQDRVKLERNLVRAVSAGAYLPVDPGLVYVGGVAEPGRFEEAYREICAELFRLVREPVEGEELRRTRDNVAADFIYARETVQGQAQQLGHFRMVQGDAHLEQEHLRRIAQLDPEALLQVARRYLKPALGLLALVHPRETDAPLDHARAHRIMEEAARPARKRTGARPAMVRHELDNGVRVLIRRNPAVPIVALHGAFPGGSRRETADQSGAFRLMSETFTRGTARRDVFTIARDADRAGGHLDGFSGRNSFGVKGEFLTRHLDEALDLFCDVLTRPSLPDEEVEKAREDGLAAIRRRDDNPAAKAFRAFEALLYGAHPLGRDLLGTIPSVSALTPVSLRELYAAHARPETLAVAVVGDVDPDRVLDLIAGRLAFPEPSGAPNPEPGVPDAPGAPRMRRIDSPHEQAHVVAGFLGATLFARDRYALRVANAMLSGQGGRLFRALRDERGLAYSVTSVVSEGLDRGYLAGYIATAPEQALAARDGLLDEMDKLARGEFEAEEVEEAKRKLVGSFEIGMQENGFQASQMALDEVFGTGYRTFLDFGRAVTAVTPGQVARAARRHLLAERWACAIVGPED